MSIESNIISKLFVLHFMEWHWFRKSRRTRDQIANICLTIDKASEIQKKKSASLTILEPLTVWITTNCETILKRWRYQTSFPVSWETCLWVKKQQLEANMEQWNRSNLERVQQGCRLSPCIFNLYAECIIQNARLDETQVGIKNARRNSNHLRYVDDITIRQKVKRN